MNFSTIARDTGVSSKTIKGDYQILEDTLIVAKIEPLQFYNSSVTNNYATNKSAKHIMIRGGVS